MKFKKHFNPLVLITILVLTTLLLSVAATVRSIGNTYTVDLIENIYSERMPDDAITVSFEDEGIARVDDVHFTDQNTVIITVSSLGSGSTNAIINVKGKWDTVLSLYVNNSGTIIDADRLNFSGYQYAEGVILFCFAFVAVMMSIAYIRCFKHAQFDYSMIAYGGIAIFSAAMFLYPLIRLLLWLPHEINFRYFIGSLTETGLYFVLVSAPVMLVVCGAFAFSNIWLIRHEGFRPVNLLGIGLGVIWFVGLQIIFNHSFVLAFLENDEAIHYIYNGTSYVVSLMECLLFSVMFSAFLSVRYKPALDKDYIIILGCCIRSNGDLTPLLRGRVDSALEFEKKQFDSTGRHAKFVPSGGQGADEIISESEAMKRYLLTQGIPEEQILKEDQSVNTDQNILFSREVIGKDSGDADHVKAAFATTNYHIFRGYVLSKKHKLNAQGISAKTKWYFFPNAFLREFIGLLVDKIVPIAIILVFITVMFLWIKHLINLMF